jgi:hypothetical protein
MNLILSLNHARPGGQWVLNGGYETLEWLPWNTTSKPTLQELESAWDEIKDEVAWEPVRKERNNLLTQSDWTQLSDSSADKVAWASYRQALRDIPQNFSNPEDVTWPAKPE